MKKNLNNSMRFIAMTVFIAFLTTTICVAKSTDEKAKEKLIRRGEFIKMLLTNAGYTPTTEESIGDSKFTDVEKNTWYVAYGNKAAQLGLVPLDTEHTTLQPKGFMSRAEGLKMALLIAGIPTPAYVTEDEIKFSDVSENDWFAAYAVKAIALKIFDTGKYFYPEKKLTESEAEDLINTINNYTGTTTPTVNVTINGSTTGLENFPHEDILQDVWDKIINQYYAPGGTDITTEDIAYDTIKGMVNALGDKHTTFETPDEAVTIVQTLNGEFVGIGVYISDSEDQVVITGFIEGSPAEKAGLLVNDIITKVDDIDVTEKSLEETAQLIRGEKGTDVKVTVQRNGTEKSFTITRDTITVTYTQDKLLPNGIWYIKFSLFSENTATEIENAIADLQKLDDTPSGLVLDLRYNPGGYLNGAQALLSHFIPEGETIFKIANTGDAMNFNSTGPADLKNIPLVILMNESSASAAEVAAAVLQETKIAKIVGMQSYGKGTAQGIYYYADGSLLKLTIAEWLTPGGSSVNGVGVTPNFVVDRTADDLTSGNDPQLNEATGVIGSWGK